MDDELEDEESGKISIVLGVFGTLVFLILDIISFIPFVGDIEGVVSTVGVIIGFVSDLGGSIMATWSVVTIAKYIPIVQELPLWTIGWWFAWYAKNHPSGIANKALTVTQEAASLAEGAEAVGEGAAAAGEGVAAAESGAGEMAEEGVEKAGKAAEDAAKSAETAAGAAESAGAAAESEEGIKNAENVTGGGNVEDEMTPENARNPMDVLGEDIDMPDMDFTNGDKDKEDSDEEELMAA